MLRIYQSIVDQHDMRLVILAVVICVFSSFTTLSLISRARLANRALSYRWIAGASLVCGCGIWATHFVAMLGYQPGLAMVYDFWLTVASAVIAISACAVGFTLALRRGMNSLGGAIAGGSDGAMHYIGMTGVYVAAQLHWDPLLIASSLAIGVVFGAVAMTIARHFSGQRGLIASTIFLSIGICIGHFSGMAALTMTPDPSIQLPAQSISPFWLALATTALTLLIAGLGLAGSLIDKHLHKIDAANKELARAAAEIEAALSAADSANKSKAQFLANVSHELRTPLTTVIGYSEMLKDQVLGPVGSEAYRGYAADIFDSGTHLAGLIGDIHAFSKLDAGRFELKEQNVNLNDIVLSCKRILDLQAAREKVEVSVACDVDLPELRGDYQRLRQVVINLLSNAVKFTPEGGKVRISTTRRDGSLALEISDTGIGMALKDIPTALARFGQIDSKLSRKYLGTGLGLPLAKELVELHGGRLAIDSTVGAGTTVSAWFPPERVLGLQGAV